MSTQTATAAEQCVEAHGAEYVASGFTPDMARADAYAEFRQRAIPPIPWSHP